MNLTIWYLMMTALLWSVFYRSAVADKRTKFCIRLGLTAVGAVSVLGMVAPLYGWAPDYVVTVIVMAIVYMQITFARFWSKHVPDQYIKPEYRIHSRRESDFAHSQFRELA